MQLNHLFSTFQLPVFNFSTMFSTMFSTNQFKFCMGLLPDRHCSVSCIRYCTFLFKNTTMSLKFSTPTSCLQPCLTSCNQLNRWHYDSDLMILVVSPDHPSTAFPCKKKNMYFFWWINLILSYLICHCDGIRWDGPLNSWCDRLNVL